MTAQSITLNYGIIKYGTHKFAVYIKLLYRSGYIYIQIKIINRYNLQI